MPKKNELRLITLTGEALKDIKAAADAAALDEDPYAAAGVINLSGDNDDSEEEGQEEDG